MNTKGIVSVASATGLLTAALLAGPAAANTLRYTGDPISGQFSVPVTIAADLPVNPPTFQLCSGTNCVSYEDVPDFSVGAGTLSLSFDKQSSSLKVDLSPCPIGQDGARIALSGVSGGTTLIAVFTDSAGVAHTLGPLVQQTSSRTADTGLCTSGS